MMTIPHSTDELPCSPKEEVRIIQDELACSSEEELKIIQDERCPEEELKIIQELWKKADSNLREGNNYYILSLKWYRTWEKYTNKHVDEDDESSNSSERPGPIDNVELVSSQTDGQDAPQLLRSVEEQKDFVYVPEEAWEKLHEWYKGGPVLARKMITVGIWKQFQVETFLLSLNLIDSRDDSHCFIELSRKATLEDLYDTVCKLKELEPENVRIVDFYEKKKVTVLAPEKVTLDSAMLFMDQDILLEVQQDGSWPSDQMEMEMDGGCELVRNVSRKDRGMAGLQNLGNTCFMNSSLQCLAHTSPIMDYFLKDYRDEINEENPLGMKGELALVFGNLLRKLWSSGSESVPPRVFKHNLGRFAPQFSGYNQQDSQELLAFLLDGLHEDLNRVKKKPYIEAKDSDGRPDEEVADDFWRNHKARNDSIIVDACQGQYKSTLVCPACKKLSVTFDPFMYLSVPLPQTATREMTVTVMDGDGDRFPTPFTVTVLKHASCEDLIQALASACNLSENESLLLAEVYNSEIFRLVKGSDPVEDIKDADTMVAYRLPKIGINFTRLEITHRGRKKKYKMTPFVTLMEDPQSSLDVHEAVARVLAPFKYEYEISDNDSESEDELPFFHLYLKDRENEDSTSRPIEGDTPRKFGPVLRVVMDWTKREVDEYDRMTTTLPAVREHSTKDTKVEEIPLLSCLDAFLKEEPLGPDDMWFCPNCKEHRQASKKLDLWRLPDVLIFHLKRFSYRGWQKKKLGNFVDFPIRNLDLSSYVNSSNKGDEDYVYELYGISDHYGGLGGGHYTASCKLIDDENKWCRFDDSWVSPVDEDSIRTSAAYVLFYQRVRKSDGMVVDSA